MIFYTANPGGALGAALDRFRRAANPYASAAHVTVAGPLNNPDRRLEEPFNDRVGVGLRGAGMWAQADGRFTVYVPVSSRKLQAVRNTPLYPEGPLHLTLYNGPDRALAARVFEIASSPLLDGEFYVEGLTMRDKTLSATVADRCANPAELPALWAEVIRALEGAE